MKYLLPCFVLILGLTACAPSVTHVSEYKPTPVVADGNPEEWSMPLSYYDVETKLNYTVANDKDRLYICIRASEPQTQVKMLRSGMTLKLELLDKTEHKISIGYPNPPKEKMSEEDKQAEKLMAASKNGHKRGLGFLGDMQLSGFKAPIGATLAPQNEYGLNIGIKRDSNNVLIYEAIIPFGTFYKPEINFGDCKKEWVLSITLNGLPESGERKRDHDGAEDASGMGGRSGGGMGGGGMGAMGGGGMGARGGGGMGGRGGGGRGGQDRSAGASGPSPYEAHSFKIGFRTALK